MKKRFFYVLAAIAIIASSCCQEKTPRAKHVIFLGFDAMSAIGIQRAETPTFNYMIENGAVSLDTRCGRETSSSQNWMSMVTGAPFEMTGVTSNDWQRDSYSIIPATANKLGIFPTMFDCLREQQPGARMEAYIEWAGETRMYDMSVFDKTLCSDGQNHYDAEQILDAAFESYLENEPELLFVSIDLTDAAGHSKGHESQGFFDAIHRMDERVGEFLKELESRNMLKDAVIIITADHGGINYGHGGDSMAELQIPVIMYGKGVTKGKVMEHANMIYDNAATVAGLLGFTLPQECRGKFMMQAFEPKTNVCYVPVPLVTPFKGVVLSGETVTLTADVEGAEIFYTLDGSVPTKESTKYEGPFELPQSCCVQAVTYKNGNYSQIASNFLAVSKPDGEACVQYKLYMNYMGEKLPDFTKFGRADAVGYVSNFSLQGLPVKSSDDHYAAIFSSNIEIAESGNYDFRLTSDDGSKLIIDDNVVIDNDGSHSMNLKNKRLYLEKGSHIIKVEYFEDCEGQGLSLEFAPVGMPLRPVLPEDLTK
ncbi:MAG: alkaline phosphatase family protein [Bacteroidales bacterium]|nr:alkaline phosphatase family protein [Bacteroidales bacterium]